MRENDAPGRILPVLIVLALSVLVLAVYRQTGSHPFISLDDGEYVYENAQVRSGLSWEGVRWAFTTFHAANWHPLTWLSHMADVELFGLNPGWHHRVNVLLHLLNTVLLFLVLWRMTAGTWQSAFVAALFAVHPLHVESVAWVAERKDLLSTMFWLLTLRAYLGYVRSPCIARYLPVAAFFALGLMCKPMLVTLPFVLLLLDWWPLGRLPALASADPGAPGEYSRSGLLRLIPEKVPLLALSALSCVVTYAAQGQGRAVIALERVPLVLRLSNALTSYAAYLGKTVWPASLAVFYPHPASLHAGIALWKVAGAALLLGALSGLALRERRRRPYLAVGWFWYLGTLVPVIGLVQVGAQALADRYSYVPLIGIFVAAAWGVPSLLPLRGWRGPLLAGAGTAVVAALTAAAYVQTGYWRNDIALYSRALAVTEDNWLAWTTLGTAYENRGNSREAIDCYREAVRIKPDFAHAWYDLGVSSDRLGMRPEAVGYYGEALRIQPRYVLAWYNRGLDQAKLGWLREAISDFREAAALDPRFANAWYNLGVAHSKLGEFREAVGGFREALRVRPDFAQAWGLMGMAYERLGDREQAAACFREAERLR